MAADGGKTDEPVKSGVIVGDEKEVKKELILLVLTGVAAALISVAVQDILMRKLSPRVKVP